MGLRDDIPAIAEMAEADRWVCWKLVERKGKLTKPPYQPNREFAKNNDPRTWRSYDGCAAAANASSWFSGIGFVLDAPTDGIMGIDWDGCRDPETGEIKPWALEWLSQIKSSTEISPSGTGLKTFVRVDPVPHLPSKKRTIEKTNGDGHDEQVEAFTEKRYFTVTGQHLDAMPDTIEDATEAVERLVHWMAEENGTSGQNDQKSPEPGPIPDVEELPAAFKDLLDKDKKLRAAWTEGKKLGRGKDKSASGLEFSLALYLSSKLSEDDLAIVLSLYPYGQIGGGKLGDKEAQRRLVDLLAEAAKAREETDRRSPSWRQDLLLNENGDPERCIANAALITREDEAFKGNFRFDELKESPVARRLPWREGDDWHELIDADDLAFAEWCQLRGVMVSASTCCDAVNIVAREHSFHPVRDWLDGLAWDGTSRLDDWLTTYLSADPGEKEQAERRARYIRAVGRRWMISAVARIYRPGCKADCALIIEGEQGLRKSTAIRSLVPNEAWFADELADLGSKDAAQGLRGKWIIELAELAAMTRGEVEKIKAFVSRQSDYIRVSYGRRTQDFPRHCIFVGTTNSDEFLMDHTGNRRFWPVKARQIDLEGLSAVRDQLWAEAVVAFQQGERWWLDSDELVGIAHDVQRDKVLVDPWEALVMEWATTRWETWEENVRDCGDNATPQPITTALALDRLEVDMHKRDQRAANRLNRIFQKNGWRKVRRSDPDQSTDEKRRRRIWTFEPLEDWRGGPGLNADGPGMENEPGPQKDAEYQTHARGGPGGPGGPGSSPNNTHTCARTHTHIPEKAA